jgi:hypothetical protein
LILADALFQLTQKHPAPSVYGRTLNSDELTAKKSVKAINFTWQIEEVLFFLTL